jgi:FlaA1/EpsC-like NDP-sugar epimerase
MEHAWGGEIFIPKIPSYKILDVAAAVAPNCDLEIVGIRPGEKIHEEMITASDSFYTYDLGKYYTILPSVPNFNLDKYKEYFKANLVPSGFNYNSGDNDKWETIATLRSLITEHLDSSFDCNG